MYFCSTVNACLNNIGSAPFIKGHKSCIYTPVPRIKTFPIGARICSYEAWMKTTCRHYVNVILHIVKYLL